MTINYMLETTTITTYEGTTYEVLMRGKNGHTFYCLLKRKGIDDYVIVYGLGKDTRDSTRFCWTQGYYFNENLGDAVAMITEKCSSIIYR